MAKRSRKKARSPGLVEGGMAGSLSSGCLLDVQPGSGVVTLPQAHVAPALPSNALSEMPPARASKQGKKDTAGAAWGHMRAPELTTELKRELLIVKMRGALDPKRFYRSADKALPKYFQMGTMVEGAADGGRRSKGSMLHGLLADDAIRKRAKSQFLKSQEAASSGVKRRSKPARGNHGSRKHR